MRPELPYLAAGAVSLIGGTAAAKGFPPHGINSVMGTTVLVIAASATAATRAAPLVHAIGLLLLLAAVMAATRAMQKPKAKPKAKK